MANTSTSEQQILQERKRLNLSDVVLRTRQATLQSLCNSFHFDNTDLLDIEFKEYQQKKLSFDRAYTTIADLTPQEIEALMPHIHVGDTIVQKCLKLAEQKEQQKKRTKYQERLATVKRVLNPLFYLALFLPNKQKASISNALNQRKQQTETK